MSDLRAQSGSTHGHCASLSLIGNLRSSDVVFEPRGMTPSQLEEGYWRAYHDFYRWGSIWRGASTKDKLPDRMRHLAYSAGWKKFDRS